MPSIYISSTLEDLADHRTAVAGSLRRMGYDVVGCEDYTARTRRPLAECVDDAESCDIYVGIFAFRYGFVPERQDASITELEWKAAEAAGVECLIFLLDENAPWPARLVDADRGNVMGLRDQLAKRHLCDTFSSSSELVNKVQSSIMKRITDGVELASDREPTQEDIRFCHDCVYRINCHSAEQVMFYERLTFGLGALGIAIIVGGLVFSQDYPILIASAGAVVTALASLPLNLGHAGRKKMLTLSAFEVALRNHPPPPEVVRLVRRFLASQVQELTA